MKFRECTIFTGAIFLVPENIRRNESPSHGTSGASYGWQLNFGGRQPFFADHSSDGSGAESALNEAIEELIRLIHLHDAPTKLRKVINASKMNDLPIGISGPAKSRKANRTVSEYNFQISIPRFGDKPTTKHVYIGTDNTFTDARYDRALAKAIAIRNKAASQYQEAATRAKREGTPVI